MASKLIEFKDGTFFEIEVPGDQVERISSKAAESIDTTIVDKIKPILLNTCKPIISVWNELNKEMHIEQAEIELGLGFAAEGNLFVTKAKTNANLIVKLTLKPSLEKDNVK